MLFILVSSRQCSKGQLPLEDTMHCQINGYTCTKRDGPRCCEGRHAETRHCVPCDETTYKKPIHKEYTTSDSCAFTSGAEITDCF